MLTLNRYKSIFLAVGVVSVAIGCATKPSTEVAPAQPLPEVPSFVKVPHPQSYEMAEIKEMFKSDLAPKDGLGKFTDTCDENFRTLEKMTTVKQEIRDGAKELVQTNAEKMHWCFYGKVARMQDILKGDESWTVRQKTVLETYAFLTPLANAFFYVYHDSQYLRWASQYYSNISEWIFFRRVEPGPENTLELTTGAAVDLETWTQDHHLAKTQSVFERYGINIHEATPAVQTAGATAPATAPATPATAPATKPATAPSTERSPASAPTSH